MSKNRNICSDPKCRNYQKYCRSHITFSVPEKKEIGKVSEKRKDLDKVYAKVRKQYLTVHPFCEAKIEGCGKVAIEIHHKKGKVGENYTDAKTFLAVCRQCHNSIEKNPAWARQQGFSISRLKKTG
jgi:hypothetical protein